MTVGLYGNGDGSAAIKVGGTDAIQISTGQDVTIPQDLTVAGTTTFTGIANFSNGFTGVTTSAIQPITATVASNAMTITLNPTTLTFRSPVASSGTVFTRTVSSPLTITIPNTATLATVANIQSRIVVICFDNSGTLELAVVNILGGIQLDETNFLSTLVIAPGSNVATNVYSASSIITSMPYRVVGCVDSTQTTAGVWAAPPTLVQGVGGQALDVFGSLGNSQTWQNLTGSRVAATTYYNTTGRPISVFVRAQTTGGATLTVNGVVCAFAGPITGSTEDGLTAIIPPSATYVFTGTLGASPNWAELR
jgi:hypothetical protein